MLYHLADIRRIYNGRTALFMRGVLDIAQGETVSIIGANGVGKSTLLRILAFIEPADAGVLFFSGDSGIAKNRQVTLLLQESYLLKRSVYENVAYGLKIRGLHKRLEEKVYTALVQVGFKPESIVRRSWDALSGGEKKRVALAARLVLEPRALLLDEPTAYVDAQSAQTMLNAVHEAVHKGITVIVASHDDVWLEQLGGRRVLLTAV